MIQTFRRFFTSKIGIVVSLAFLALIALAFASMDVSSNASFGGLSSGDTVAVVGDNEIKARDLTQAANSGLDQQRQQDPTASMASFVERGAFDDVLMGLIDRNALRSFGERYGLRSGKNLINSEILQIPAFRGADGEFDENAYQQILSQQGVTDAMLRDDLAQGLFARQLLQPAGLGASLPETLIRRIAAFSSERRVGGFAVIPSAAFAPEGKPDAATLRAFYEDNRADFIRPERRTLRYATFNADALGDAINPTDAEIAARYRENASEYAASENRSVTQLIVPTEAAAKSIAQRVRGGTSLAAAAREAGLGTTSIGPADRKTFASQTSAAVTQAIFDTGEGRVAPPARSGLGWHVALVTDVESVAGRTLAQARSEIAGELREEKRRRLLNETAGDLEQRLSDGEALSDVAKDLGIKVQITRPLIATGQIYGSAGEFGPDVIAPALQSAFEMDESEPQLAEVERGETFLLYEVTRIEQSAAAPIKDIEEELTLAWRISEGSKKARAAADRIMKRVAGGQSLAAAVNAEKATLPAPRPVNMTRQQLAAAQPQGVEPQMALLFSMAEGTTKKLAAPRNIGWFVVNLDEIETGTVADDSPLLEQARQQIGTLAAQEYSEQLINAIRSAEGVERNEEAIAEVRASLLGNN
ncbi:Peptidylprolyl isomerase [Alteripontixanthobacter maritimus]|uniref:Parvulin-like PPIase n=1 Tax=Alteripontixanthobacter maritimus TaxID=2161824 RepID=A0A369Q9Z0_9SPHN|nr:SurA N-terminal domain-containing protein [Alteripontixanthobacter maritimus]RDC60016.1 Peptidylprolyl isomerase [Alteripontixanthobacter maritimus]